MTPEQAAEHLRVIRELMERPVRHTTRSGLAGIVAGVLALAGTALTCMVMPPLSEPGNQDFMRTMPPESALWQAGLIWLGVLLVAATVDVLVARRRARQRGERWWRRAQVQTALAIVPGFVLAAFFTWLFHALRSCELIPFGWMIGYGMALWTVGMFSIVEVKVLAAAFLLTGWAGLLAFVGVRQSWMPTSLTMTAVAFGGFHLLYGLVVWKRHGG